MRFIVRLLCLPVLGKSFLLLSPATLTTTKRSSTITAPPQQEKTSTLLYMNKKKSIKKKKKSKKVSSSPLGFTTGSTQQQKPPFPYAGAIRPGLQSPQKVVTDKEILKPDYADDGMPKNNSAPTLPLIIDVKTSEEIEKMRAAGRVAREVLDIGGRAIQVGVTTDEIDTIVHEEALKRGAYPSPLNYHGFPKSCCTSVNEVICHGIPDNRKLEDGDIINLDITCYLDGYHGDCSEMYVVGEADASTKKLLQATYDSWVKAMEFCRPSRDYKDIGAVIEDFVTREGFSSVRSFCGHGIGSVFHASPDILHFRNNVPNGQMAAGHTFTIEPVICEGSAQALLWRDEWTATTADGKLCAQFEHTLLITSDGTEALTGKIESSPLQFWEIESEVHRGFWLGNTKASKKKSVELTANAMKKKGVVAESW